MAVEAAFKAFADPHRREILRLVWDAEMSASDIASNFTITRQAVSQHLRVLKDSGLLEERRDGTRRLYRSRRERIAELREYLDDFWGAGLRRLKKELERSPDA